MANELIIPTGYEIFRYDKNIVTNLSRINNLIEDEQGDSRLLRSLLCYFSYEHQHNIFNEGIIDMDKFAKDYNYSRSYLCSKHPHPYQFANLPPADIEKMRQEEQEEECDKKQGVLSKRLFDNNFENALYVMQYCPLSIITTGGYYRLKGGMDFIKGSISIRFIKELYCFRKGQKILYYYVLDEDFVKNLTGYFLVASRQSIVALSSRNLDGLYLNLCNLKANLLSQNPPQFRTTPENTPSFDVCCRWANIPLKTKNGDDVEPKYVKRRLNSAFKYVQDNTDLRFKVEWCEHEYTGMAYVPCFVFPEFDARPNVIRRDVNNEFQRMFREEIKRHMSRRFRELYAVRNEVELNVENFYNWLRSKDVNPEEKRNAFETAYFVAYKNIPDDIDKRYGSFLSQILHGCEIDDFVV